MHHYIALCPQRINAWDDQSSCPAISFVRSMLTIFTVLFALASELLATFEKTSDSQFLLLPILSKYSFNFPSSFTKLIQTSFGISFPIVSSQYFLFIGKFREFWHIKSCFFFQFKSDIFALIGIEVVDRQSCCRNYPGIINDVVCDQRSTGF
ncbi:unnamed protein product [Albugo candida]|uniref:Uncharacterized protein n=1 Tax=Albugo candida TaxID=65357 RepID=A0A024FU59_9STRA|nr:unnamed protein product [Albugo candida]|eukprot:CCI10199.1 unnamed protein product [Albugo candida]